MEKKSEETQNIKACTSCKQIPKPHEYHDDGSVYHNLICGCKKTPLERCSMGADTHTWNTKWYDTDPKIVNEKAGWESSGPFKTFHYYM
ncbi:MAG: hypothetical protein WC010_01320 [Candidatus Absconditabacterales bacterium]